jgi:hypothetical protein
VTRVLRLWNEDPEQDVRDKADAAEDEEYARDQTDDPRLDVEETSDTCANAAKNAFIRISS